MKNAKSLSEAACDIQWRREAGMKGAYTPGGNFQGAAFQGR